VLEAVKVSKEPLEVKVDQVVEVHKEPLVPKVHKVRRVQQDQQDLPI
jgi:hypothetical protein